MLQIVLFWSVLGQVCLSGIVSLSIRLPSLHPRPRLSLYSSVIDTPTIQTVAPTESPQVLNFTDAATNTTVVLIGSMHYNPISIELTKNAINHYASLDQLG